jgi:hypothetical protein
MSAARASYYRSSSESIRLLSMSIRHFGTTARRRPTGPNSRESPNNLFSPVVHDGGIHGDFVAEASRTSPYQKITAAGGLKWLAAGALAAIAISQIRRHLV